MANKKPGMEVSSPTYLRTRLSDGRVIGVDGSVWLVRRVPLEPVADAKSVQERMNTFVPLLASFDELAAMSGSAGGRRALARNSYRQVHVLMVNLHRLYNPPAGHPIAGYLKQAFPHQVTERRVLLMAVQLQPKVGGSGGLRAAIDSVVETITIGGAPMSDFDDDHRKVDAALTRCGLTTPSTEDMTISNSWWNQGHFPDTVELPHSDHLHVFSDATAVRMAKQAGPEKCEEWPTIPNHRILTMSTLEGFDFDFIAASDPAAHWATGLIEDGAVAISIRGRIEPASITRQELRRQRKRYLDDINEAADNGKMERSEQTEMVHTLEQVEGVYASQGGSPTLVDASCLVAFDGEVEDITQVGPSSAANLRVMNFRQRQALSEMMLCSPIRSNPNLHDMPSQVVAASGIQSLSTVGDKTGALVGFTERDQQPAYVSPTAASANDAAPLFNNVGATGSGKTMLLLWKAWQYAKMGGPQIIIDPKTGSDHSAIVYASGGQVASLDQLQTADGIFDPIRFSLKPEVGVELAASMLASINPWGANAGAYEVPLYNALSFGVSNGAKCIGQALDVAVAAGRAHPDMVRPIKELADSSPMFRACVGINPTTKGLAIAEGITLIKVGDSHLNLPEPSAIKEATLMQRISLALVRMMVFGSAMALTGRGGAIHLDEAWVFFGAGKTEVERLGRLARSQNVLPEMYTQRATDALNAGLAGYISRGIILPIEDEDEARAALKLFKLEDTPERMSRITAKATIGDAGSVAPNWNSMRALRDPVTGRVLRGSVGYYIDLSGRAVPIEIKLPPSFLKVTSTNPDDIRRRLEEEALHKAAAQSHAA